MTLGTLLAIVVLLIIGIILIKAIRKILTVILTLVLIYFLCYTLMTYSGAIKLSLFASTWNFNSYRVYIDEYKSEGEHDLSSKPIELGKEKIINITCKKYKPIIICEAEKSVDNENS